MNVRAACVKDSFFLFNVESYVLLLLLNITSKTAIAAMWKNMHVYFRNVTVKVLGYFEENFKF